MLERSFTTWVEFQFFDALVAIGITGLTVAAGLYVMWREARKDRAEWDKALDEFWGRDSKP